MNWIKRIKILPVKYWIYFIGIPTSLYQRCWWVIILHWSFMACKWQLYWNRLLPGSLLMRLWSSWSSRLSLHCWSCLQESLFQKRFSSWIRISPWICFRFLYWLYTLYYIRFQSFRLWFLIWYWSWWEWRISLSPAGALWVKSIWTFLFNRVLKMHPWIRIWIPKWKYSRMHSISLMFVYVTVLSRGQRSLHVIRQPASMNYVLNLSRQDCLRFWYIMKILTIL